MVLHGCFTDSRRCGASFLQHHPCCFETPPSSSSSSVYHGGFFFPCFNMISPFHRDRILKLTAPNVPISDKFKKGLLSYKVLNELLDKKMSDNDSIHNHIWSFQILFAKYEQYGGSMTEKAKCDIVLSSLTDEFRDLRKSFGGALHHDHLPTLFNELIRVQTEWVNLLANADEYNKFVRQKYVDHCARLGIRAHLAPPNCSKYPGLTFAQLRKEIENLDRRNQSDRGQLAHS